MGALRTLLIKGTHAATAPFGHSAEAPILFLKAPTPAQAEAGNYKKRHIRFRGLDISIENPKGSVRTGVDRDGHEWRVKMRCAYGYIRRTEGVDGDHVDVYLGPDEDAENVYIVHQRQAGNWKEFDEDKCMLGFPSLAAAKQAYLRQYDDPRFLGPITTLPFDEFKAKALATAAKPKMIKAFFLKARNRALPQVGDLVEFDSDRQTEKGPSSGKVIAVDGNRVRWRIAIPRNGSTGRSWKAVGVSAAGL